ncbi:dihydrofolate reductase isoform X1 [Neodiprion fabricii]|uniref:dihydrofolate reductase isoform X1 n=2 Tax=Neodiprion fabricii TaxID=2872261 RepID=UPI001ED8D42C|nr:dihydrofolate reductase isoform X1 [Neodiprion fabricii]
MCRSRAAGSTFRACPPIILKEFIKKKTRVRPLTEDIGISVNGIVSENQGIGINGRLPWRLKKEMAYFTRLTTETKDPSKKNVVIMGRRTWDVMPKKYRPLSNRINVVLTSKDLILGDEALVCKSFPDALEKLSKIPLTDKIERIWVIGGSSVYKAAMELPNFHRLYLTLVRKYFECDTYFPPISNEFHLVKDPEVPDGIQEENGLQYEFKVYEKA